jgi:hypothetical protein
MQRETLPDFELFAISFLNVSFVSKETKKDFGDGGFVDLFDSMLLRLVVASQQLPC